MERIRIATRRSQLALAQANLVAERLQALFSLATELVTLNTQGDRQRAKGADVAVGGKGSFTEALEEALRQGRADIAVHSMKDLPAKLSDDFAVATFGQRADARDALITRQGNGTLAALPAAARVGTSSARRRTLLANLRRDLRIVPLRGNVDTRLRRLREGAFDAVLLACAGLDRLGLSARIDQRIDADVLVPAPGQGAIAVEYVAERNELRTLVAAGVDAELERQVAAERALVRRLGADCAAPFGTHCSPALDASNPARSSLRLVAVAADPAGTQLLRVELIGDDPIALADATAARLTALGFQRLR